MTIKGLIIVYLLLMVLLAATASLKAVDIGIGNLVLNMSIAAAKAGLIAWFFMRLRVEATAVRIFSLAGIVWLAILFSLTLADYLDREHPEDFYGSEESARSGTLLASPLPTSEIRDSRDETTRG